MRAPALSLLTLMACVDPTAASDAGRDGGADGGVPDAGEERPNPQESYTFEGCDDAGWSTGCPRSGVFFCALQRIEDRYDGCTRPEDCADATLWSCQGHAVCRGTAVNAADREAYLAEARAEITRYCDGGTCFSSPMCIGTPDRIDCVGQRCVWLVDGGF